MLRLPSPQLKALYSTQAIIEFDAQGRILYANAPFLELMGYRMEDLRGQHHRIFVAGPTRAARTTVTSGRDWRVARPSWAVAGG